MSTPKQKRVFISKTFSKTMLEVIENDTVQCTLSHRPNHPKLQSQWKALSDSLRIRSCGRPSNIPAGRVVRLLPFSDTICKLGASPRTPVSTQKSSLWSKYLPTNANYCKQIPLFSLQKICTRWQLHSNRLVVRKHQQQLPEISENWMWGVN